MHLIADVGRSLCGFQNTEVVFVTGASAGIGKAWAHSTVKLFWMGLFRVPQETPNNLWNAAPTL